MAKTNEELREQIQKAHKRDKIYAAKIGMQKKITAIYVRVSTSSQSTRSQKPNILRWIKAGGIRFARERISNIGQGIFNDKWPWPCGLRFCGLGKYWRLRTCEQAKQK